MQPISLTVSLMMQNFSAPEFILSFAAPLFFFAMLYLLCNRIYLRKITNRFDLNDFDYVINNRQALIGIKNDRNSSRSAAMYMLAVAYFAKGNDEAFLSYVNQIKHPDYIGEKIYMQALHSIVTQNGYFPMLREQLIASSSPEKVRFLTRLDCITELCCNPYCDVQSHKIFIMAFNSRNPGRITDFIAQCRNNMKEGL